MHVICLAVLDDEPIRSPAASSVNVCYLFLLFLDRGDRKGIVCPERKNNVTERKKRSSSIRKTRQNDRRG